MSVGINYEENRFWYRITNSKRDNGLPEIFNDDIVQYLINFIPMNRQREVELYIIKEEQDIENEDDQEQIRLGIVVSQDKVLELDNNDLNEHIQFDKVEYQSDDYEFGVDDVNDYQSNEHVQLYDLTLDNVEFSISMLFADVDTLRGAIKLYGVSMVDICI